MKKIITFLFASVLFTTSFAQFQNRNDDRDDDEQYGRGNNNSNTGIYNNNQNSVLIVNSSSQNRFVVSIDNNNEYQSNDNNGYGNTVNVGALQAGNHTVTIYEVKKGFFGNQKQQQIYSSVLYFKPSTETSININYNGQVSVTEKPLYNNGGWYGGNASSSGPGNNGNGRGYGYGRKKDKHKHGKHDHDRGDRDDRDDKDNYTNSNLNNYPNQYPGNNRQISDYDFAMLKQYIRKEAFDDRRINIAKQAAGNNNFSTTQVRDIMSIFSFDEGKLDVAKYFYNRTVDRNNYYQLTDALSFSDSKDKLLAFIRK
jgi:Domain of unknown function (DUF4476)